MSEAMEIVQISTLMNESAGTMLCTIDASNASPEERKTVFNAMNNPTYKISDYINKIIKVENVLVQVNDLLDDETGAINRVPRVVLISPDGTSYTATSKGIFNSVVNAFNAFGAAPWKGGIDFEVKQVQVGRGQMLTLEMV